MKRLIASCATIAVVGACAVVAVSSTQALAALRFVTHTQPASSPPAWSCVTGSYFQVINGQVSTSRNLVTWKKVGRKGQQLNALAYSPYTHFLYGLLAVKGKHYQDLIRVDRTGTEVDLGAVHGLNLRQPWNAGDIDPETGNYYVAASGSLLTGINPSTRVAWRIAVPAPTILGQDLIVQNAWVWSVTASRLEGFSLQTGATKQFVLTVGTPRAAAGAMWSAPSADGLSFRWNDTGVVYRITGLRTSADAVTLVTHGQVTSKLLSDGATCTARQTDGPDTAPVLTVAGSSLGAFWPGRSRTVNLSFTNTYPSAVTVKAGGIATSIVNSSTSCPAAGNFSMSRGLMGAVTVPASATVTLQSLGVPTYEWPVIAMHETGRNQDHCEGTSIALTFTVTYSGR